MWAYVAGFIFNIVVNLIFIPKYSYIGASWTTVVTELLVLVCIVSIVRKRIKFEISFSVLFRAVLVAAVVGGFVFYAISDIQTPLGVSRFIRVFMFGVGIFIVASYLLRLHKILPSNLLSKTDQQLD